MKNLVSIIIVNWNGLKHLEPCLKSLYKVSYKNYEIIIVDNSSTDKSVNFIKQAAKRNKRIILIENNRNTGYAEGNNIGIQKARGEYILFLNNDTIVTSGFIEPLIDKLAQNSKIAGVQPKILQYPKTRILDSVGSYFLTTGFLYHLGYNKHDQKKYHTPSYVYTLKGACMLFRKSVLNKIGLLDESYFAYFEETDLCHRAWLAGYSLWYEPSSTIYHKGGETAKKVNTAFITYLAYRNRIVTYIKNFEYTTIFNILFFHLLLCNVVALAYIAKGYWHEALAIHKAIWWNFFHLPQVLKDRDAVQLQRKKSDKEILEHTKRSVRISYYWHLFSSLKGYED